VGELARLLILFGLVCVVLGVLFLVGPKIPGAGKLPGDILIRREETTIYIPLATSLIVSIVLTLLINFLVR
jgi:hypothetical protein